MNKDFTKYFDSKEKILNFFVGAPFFENWKTFLDNLLEEYNKNYSKLAITYLKTNNEYVKNEFLKSEAMIDLLNDMKRVFNEFK